MNGQLPRILRHLFKHTVWQKKTSSKVIYLTFDDGPTPEITTQVLDILDIYSWKATFFCVGENVQKYPEIYKEVLSRGHRTGNHSYNHLKGYNHSCADYVENVKKASTLIDSKLFRPPYGRITFKQIKALHKNYHIIMWDVITHDYNKKLSHSQVLNNVKNNLRKGSIVVFHDSNKAKSNLITVLPQAIEFWQENGYEYGLL